MHRADAQPRQAARHACGRSRACCRAPQLMPALTHTHSVGVAESGWRLATSARRSLLSYPPPQTTKIFLSRGEIHPFFVDLCSRHSNASQHVAQAMAVPAGARCCRARADASS